MLQGGDFESAPRKDGQSFTMVTIFKLALLRSLGTEIRYTPVPKERYPKGSTPSEITRHSMDSSYQLEEFLKKFTALYGDAVSSAMSDLDQ